MLYQISRNTCTGNIFLCVAVVEPYYRPAHEAQSNTDGRRPILFMHDVYFPGNTHKLISLPRGRNPLAVQACRDVYIELDLDLDPERWSTKIGTHPLAIACTITTINTTTASTLQHSIARLPVESPSTVVGYILRTHVLILIKA